ncbi:MAG: hypothetical protein H0U81_06935 [Pyrinomonadaceae bacterium]|nr:hypothetical protein [Pyrinomonadaceae bacterium]
MLPTRGVALLSTWYAGHRSPPSRLLPARALAYRPPSRYGRATLMV